MSQQVGIIDVTFVADASLIAKQYYILKMQAAGTPMGVILGSATTSVAIGVLQNEPAAGEAAVVRVAGTTKVLCGTPIAIGGPICSDSGGKADNADAAKDFILGYALETAAASGDIIEMLIDRGLANP